MSEKITKVEAATFVGNYHAACVAKNEDKTEVTRYFEVERTVIEKIFTKADENDLKCQNLRIYLAKKSPYNGNLAYPKFSSKDDYNLVIVGVDDKGSNILSTLEIHDHLGSVTGPLTGNEF